MLNPTWQVRCLDATTALHFAPRLLELDLTTRAVTAQSLSDILRIELLHEFGGVWADATTFCNRPLDDWLPQVFAEGFFAFDRPGPDRPLASWFLAARPGNSIAAAWARSVDEYWRERVHADRYFWLHSLFDRICDGDPSIARSWARVPKISADGPHQIQWIGMHSAVSDAANVVDWTTPVFKLTHRLDPELDRPGSLLRMLFGTPFGRRDVPASADPPQLPSADGGPDLVRPLRFASLRVGTENLGDHIQIIASNRLLGRFGVRPSLWLDRDFELKSAPGIGDDDCGIVLNGWFKRDSDEWPPHNRLKAILLGFHIRLFQSPSLLSQESVLYYRAHQPVGARDHYTAHLLKENGVEAVEGGCLSLTFPRRVAASSQAEVFVVSRDTRLVEAVPETLGPTVSILHYSGDTDFFANLRRAEMLLATYRDRAKLIVTSLLHCALPALAMGIPVVMFYPPNSPAGRLSDQQRFSSLQRLVPIWRLDQMHEVDWAPAPVDVGEIKLALIDQLTDKLIQIGADLSRSLGPIAPSSLLPPP